MRRWRLTIALATAAALLAAAPAAADDTNPDGTGVFVPEGDGDVIVIAEDDQPGGGSGGGGGGNCFWRLAIADDFTFAVYGDYGRVFSETGRWYELVCDGVVVFVGGQGIVAQGGLVDVDDLVARAKNQVAIASPPVATNPDGRLYVGVPTWLWIDGGWWHEYTATATAGRVTATVTVRPLDSTWSTGDGNRVTCAGGGTAWHAGADEGETDCSHTYRRASSTESDGRFPLGVTARLGITWTSNAGLSGSLPAISRSSSRPVEVGEIQALETE